MYLCVQFMCVRDRLSGATAHRLRYYFEEEQNSASIHSLTAGQKPPQILEIKAYHIVFFFFFVALAALGRILFEKLVAGKTSERLKDTRRNTIILNF